MGKPPKGSPNRGRAMAKQEKTEAQLRCSFCGKGREEVRKLIAGPTVYICDECVDLCNDIIAEDLEEKQEAVSSKLPKPKEIMRDRKSTRLNSSHSQISYAVFCLKKKKDH